MSPYNIVLWVTNGLFMFPADSFNINRVDSREKIYSSCEEMHTIAKEQESIVTEIKTIARLREIIASICSAILAVVVQREGPGCSRDEGITELLLLCVELELLLPVAHGWWEPIWFPLQISHSALLPYCHTDSQGAAVCVLKH